MAMGHLVKTGLMGVMGRYESLDSQIWSRDTRVICRTARGLEWGVVLCGIDDENSTDFQVAGQLLRPIGTEDELILERLERYRDKAFTACQRVLDEAGSSATLVDVEHLFDGESVFFYFLGDVDPQLETLTDKLGAEYDRKVRFRKFAETLASGCGPNCGTAEAGCASGSCSTCAHSGGCSR